MSEKKPTPMIVRDGVTYFQCCSDRFGELAALFRAIKSQCKDDDEDMAKLCSLGVDAAFDYEDIAGRWSEELAAGGFRQ